MEGHFSHHHHPHQSQLRPLLQQQQQIGVVGVEASGSGGGDRFPQWSAQETKEFLAIRAELDRSFMETKRNKLLWGVISTRMREKGYSRSAEQCKCKWKNLVTRYKGCETMEPEAMRQQFPFYNEMQGIFTARMQRMLWAEEEGVGGGAGSTSKSKKASFSQLSSDDDVDDEDSEGEKGKKKKKAKGNTGMSGSSSGEVRKILEEFMKQQARMEMEWREAYEARESERRAKEMEWRQTMEALENERIMMDRRWREREEQRRMREEARAEKRDALITALLNKLRREDHSM
ncbi:trihelix transcription factor GT-3b-like [Rhodamnia argentea]|uniref:Trihelix transcription factor GT-3b-like n=1 Tax=Rhodamnia argentea TaxID=178133 RepID=A0A8B8PSD0_9MYRT|nr:trihelix transcription factor GT-3b-like [Rhodamnia argentea]